MRFLAQKSYFHWKLHAYRTLLNDRHGHVLFVCKQKQPRSPWAFQEPREVVSGVRLAAAAVVATAWAPAPAASGKPAFQPD